GDHYHSTNGAIGESRHIFINGGLLTLQPKEIDIMEVGFGTGLNALLTAIESEERGLKIRYTAIEKYPLPASVTNRLNYGMLSGEMGVKLGALINAVPWNCPVTVTERFILEKIRADLLTWDTERQFDLVYFDAFAPGMQPEMWSGAVIGKVASWIRPGGVFVTYSARGALKRELQKAGFTVYHPPGPPGKREYTRAVKRE
ncbi:MAG: tRNA (5-methylaminomethyl-2-thiouridine)(34)-methyltransferase MnmD, partial [Bacteroidales bacterium]|nr:tRNA (5-methylaminomethyl-2-thiouridine)(34)-methyltransferase MnmD [Bacteroidales bacterium]